MWPSAQVTPRRNTRAAILWDYVILTKVWEDERERMWGCDRMCIFVIICLANVGKVYRQSKSPSLLRNLVPAPGEGIYFAAKSGRMCAKTIVKNSKQGARMIDEVSWSQGNWRIRFEDDEERWYDSLSDGMNEVVISAGHMEASTPVLDVCCLMSCCLWCFGFLVLITAEIQLYSDLIRAFCNKQSSRWLWRMDPSYFLILSSYPFSKLAQEKTDLEFLPTWKLSSEADLMEHLREWDGKYGPTYLAPWMNIWGSSAKKT